MNRPSQEIAPKESLQTLSYSEAMAMAKTIASSNLCPQSLRGKPNDVFVVLAKGHEMGLTPMLALQNLYVVGGKVGMSADLMRARCLERSECAAFDVVEADANHATVRVMKSGWSEPVDVLFEISEAKAAGLVKADSNWSKWPQDMNVARATSRAARRYFPAVVAGIYTPEELADIPVERPAIAMPRAMPPDAVVVPEPMLATEDDTGFDPLAREVVALPFDPPAEEPEPPMLMPNTATSIPDEAWADVRRVWHNGGFISEAQRRRLFAIAATNGWKGDDVAHAVEAALGVEIQAMPWGKPYDKTVSIFSSFQPRTE